MVKDHKRITLNEALQKASFFLNQQGFDPSLARHYWMELFDWDLTRIIQSLNQPISNAQVLKFEKALSRIVEDEPIQYIRGYAYFMDHIYHVSPACLIPREETAGLVDKAVKYMAPLPPGKVLDLGTGSGIIAIELKKALPDWEVYASDLSSAALKIASRNAADHQVKINFIQSDLFSALDQDLCFDVLVSNPPYIGKNEVELMDASVKKYEPQLALYAKEEGLAIYKQIANHLPQRLMKKGAAFFEIGFSQGQAVKNIFQAAFPASDIQIGRDFADKERYISMMKEG
ncbi:peptide chain release factor N(5)-glutamine methyltransferase [Facklamia miroungae]|uniref:Release factor glutamine methyltransferase n=1 Tax=Facklamia miroungae TaxID=120956 RepID=A0A1G7TSD1_9LACT|nr:peptide chain release factor N(5)-glutamine methyltransferase [Facklamia miroungae]NKZ29951.1 peptide chain release factor N(5)-glutamine methyltransferase [Facklamia miroungae]SDG38191.1 release factor glutamine methyltransferase [Facklamia miroungae]